jgi:hypothetical protein
MSGPQWKRRCACGQPGEEWGLGSAERVRNEAGERLLCLWAVEVYVTVGLVVAVFSAVIAFRGVTVFLNVSDALARVTFELRRWMSTIGAVGGVVGHAGVHGRLCVGGEKRFLCGHKLQ